MFDKVAMFVVDSVYSGGLGGEDNDQSDQVYLSSDYCHHHHHYLCYIHHWVNFSVHVH